MSAAGGLLAGPGTSGPVLQPPAVTTARRTAGPPASGPAAARGRDPSNAPAPAQRALALAAAEEALALVQDAPDTAADLARRALAAGSRDPEVVSVAERALGLAARERYDVVAALRHLRRAVAVAERAGLRTRAAQARTSLSLALAYAGRSQAALEEADRAAPDLTGTDAARLAAQRALVLQRLGRHEEALAGYRRAVPRLRRDGDALWEARARVNRGALLTYRGSWSAAETDLRRAEALALQLRQDLLLSLVRHNLGFLAARRGDVPTALQHYERAEATYRRTGGQRSMLLLDRCEALLSVHLVSEARAAAEQAVAELAAAGAAPDLAEARLALAAAALAGGDTAVATAEARSAAAALRRQHRPAWALLARDLEVRARAAAGEQGGRLVTDARAVAAALEQAGWTAEAVRARLTAGRAALAAGRSGQADADLAAAAAHRSRGSAQARATAWHALALQRQAAGEGRAARHALAAGLRVLDDARTALGATELRATAAASGEEMAGLGLRLALATGRPRTVLAWAERWRAGALRQAPALPPDDDRLADDLAELRRVTAVLDEARLAGRPEPGLAAQQARLEAAVRERARRASGAAGPAERLGGADDLLEALGDRALVELVRCEGELWAVVAAAGRVSLSRLGSAARVARETVALRAALRRLALRHGTPASLGAARAAARHAAAHLDADLLAPVRRRTGDRPLVVVPTGDLHALPWALLPGCAGRPVTVAPSAAAWRRAACTPEPRRGAPVLVAGPALEHAEDEVRALADAYGGAVVLTGADATAGAVSRALEGAPAAHLATHGRFRADNPLFSCLVLADGPLTVYDLERLRRAPALLVLSACDGGLSGVTPGDELRGLTAALLGQGTRTVVASVAPADDATARALMERLHARLRDGEGPAEALAAAQASLTAEAGDDAETVAGFACFGAG